MFARQPSLLNVAVYFADLLQKYVPQSGEQAVQADLSPTQFILPVNITGRRGHLQVPTNCHIIPVVSLAAS